MASMTESSGHQESLALQYVNKLPPRSRARLEKACIDLSNGYPYIPETIPKYVDEVLKIRDQEKVHVDPGTRADPEKRALLRAAKEVIHLTKHIGTEIVGLQLKNLTDQQKDELGLLIAERSVVFFRDQDLDPREQLKLGEYYGEVEVHPQAPRVPGLDGVTVIWPDYKTAKLGQGAHFRKPGGSSSWHADLVHEKYPAGDTVPEVGGDTIWASGYGAYEKLSPDFRKMIDGKCAVYRSANQYVISLINLELTFELERGNETSGPKYVERIHPLVRVHPVTRWKSLYVNRLMTVSIVGLDKPESDLILNYLFDVYEKHVDIQVRFRWTPGSSAIWDNRITIHTVSWDYEGTEPRHGTRVTALAEKPFFDPKALTRREGLGFKNATVAGGV